MRNPFKRRPDEWFRFEVGHFLIAKDKGGIISPEGECVWMAIDTRSEHMYYARSFFRLIKILITEWRHDKHIYGYGMWRVEPPKK